MNNFKKEDELLIILMEECAEVQQEASKILRFCNTDKTLLSNEVGDLLCMIELLEENNMIDTHVVESSMIMKREKLKVYSKLIED